MRGGGRDPSENVSMNTFLTLVVPAQVSISILVFVENTQAHATCTVRGRIPDKSPLATVGARAYGGGWMQWCQVFLPHVCDCAGTHKVLCLTFPNVLGL